MEKIGVDFFSKVNMISHLKKVGDTFYVIGKIASLEKDKYFSNLYEVKNGQLRQLTFTNDIGNYDIVEGKIVFMSNREDDELTNFYYLPEFGEATKFMSLKGKVNKVVWKDLKHFLFTSTTTLPSDTFEEGKECRVFEEAPWWFNGSGDISKQRTSLYEYNEGDIKQISTPTMDVGGIKLSPDQSFAFVTGKEFEGFNGNGNDLWMYQYGDDHLTKITPYEGASYGGTYFKSNEEAIVMINKRDKLDGIEHSSFYCMNIKENTYTMIYDGDEFGYGNSSGSDIKMGSIDSGLLFDETGFAYITTAPSKAPLVHLDTCGNVHMITTLDENVLEAIQEDGKYYMIMMVGDKANEIYELDGDKLTQLTNINDFSNYSISTPIDMTYTNKEGRELNGWVIKPVGYEEGKKYPTILDVHGGPKTIYGKHFFHEMQYWANEGYVVIFTNIRGSDGRGNNFADIRGKYGTIDYDDLMCFVDACIEQFDCIDEDHMGITGGSYGGFMTNWVIGHTSRFKAAASQRSISNWVSFANIADIGYGFAKTQNQATTWDNVELMWQQSPLKYANNCTTPTLFIHSDHDYRCPMAEGMQMFYALKVHGVDARMCLFKDETHELSRSGRPLNRIRRLKEITAWMDKYLK